MGAIFQLNGTRIKLVQITTATTIASRMDQTAGPNTKRKLKPTAQPTRVFATRDLKASTASSSSGSDTTTTEMIAQSGFTPWMRAKASQTIVVPTRIRMAYPMPEGATAGAVPRVMQRDFTSFGSQPWNGELRNLDAGDEATGGEDVLRIESLLDAAHENGIRTRQTPDIDVAF